MVNAALREKECAIDIEGEFVFYNTSHLSSFVSFFETGVVVITSTNYNVFWALKTIDWDSLIRNGGFWVVCLFWVLFYVFSVFSLHSDRKFKKQDYYFNSLFIEARS